MTVLVVPTFSDPMWTQSTTFEGTKYILEFDYNQRCACYYLSIADANGVDIYNGVKIICNVALLSKCKDPRQPPGVLMCLSSTADTSPPSQMDLLPGSCRCTLTYITSDWVAIVQSGNAAAIQSLYTQIDANMQTTNISTYGQQ